MSARKQLAPDWPQVIGQIVATGFTLDQIAGSVELSLRAVKYLADPGRGQQPIFYRGDAVLVLWCERTGSDRADVPLAEVVRGFRRARQAADRSPQVTNLPDWPRATQRTEMQGRARRPRKAKEPA